MSNEAPKKTWIHEGFWRSGDSSYWTDEMGTDPKYRNGNHYIRADLVDGLVEALKICLAGNGYEFDDRPAEAALKALEEV